MEVVSRFLINTQGHEVVMFNVNSRSSVVK